ncbi:MerR family transcriptional regulator [Treponema parvum]|uniref:MerR family transcriptional regulator n=1 Tax=Treponema parvum TaxID=138851 RepID=UPI001AEC24B5|nr:MerR family transcriptional regulator [Treponema parvum]QTQ17299.1 MerR family transcriptional regulator [Treponema parvum]
MAQYTIGDVEELTGLKAHVLRYWEEVIPGMRPKKDLGGRRVYTQREIDIIQRLKYLIYEKKFTIEGARDNIIADMNVESENAELMQNIREAKKELTDIFLTVRKHRVDGGANGKDETR